MIYQTIKSGVCFDRNSFSQPDRCPQRGRPRYIEDPTTVGGRLSAGRSEDGFLFAIISVTFGFPEGAYLWIKPTPEIAFSRQPSPQVHFLTMALMPI
jgi:hypothetical protein